MRFAHQLTRVVLAVVLLTATGGLCVTADAQSFGQERFGARKFDIALIGDLPYDAEEEAKFDNLIEDINRSKLAFVVHDGDFKSGSSLCSDETFNQRFELFETFRHPFVFIFGDNDWTDCHRPNNGAYDPVERLFKLREIFTQGDRSLGRRTIRLTRQSDAGDPRYEKFRENVRWTYGDALFVGLNLVGSNNNFGRTPEANAEFFERNEANLAWLRESFAIVNDAGLRGIMIIIQANPNFELASTNPARAGFNDFLRLLEEETIKFKRPVVLVHGDSHDFQINKPLYGSLSRRKIENFTRVETFGTPDVHWLRATIDWRDPNLFSFKQEIVEENLVNHQP